MSKMILIYGTNGSGKTTVVNHIRRARSARPGSETHLIHNWIDRKTGALKSKRNFVGREYHQEGGAPFFLVGEYPDEDFRIGGFDTLSSPGIQPPVFDTCLARMARGRTALMEGLALISMKRILDFRDRGVDQRLFFLNTDLDTCLESVLARKRRKAAAEGGDPEAVDLKPDNVVRKYRDIWTLRDKLVREGFQIVEADRAAVLAGVDELLREAA